MRQVEFRASLSRSEFKRLGQNKPSVGLMGGAVVFALAWIFSAVDLGPSQLDFHKLSVRSTGRSSVEITNRGLTEFHTASLTVEGTDARDFAVEGQPCTTVGPGESCVVWVNFRPQQVGQKRARLIVRTGDGNEMISEFSGEADEGERPAPKPHPDTKVVKVEKTPETERATESRTDGPVKTPPLGKGDAETADAGKPSAGPAGTVTKPTEAGPALGGPAPPGPAQPELKGGGGTAGSGQPQGTPPPGIPTAGTPTQRTTPKATGTPTPEPKLYTRLTMTPGIAEFRASSDGGRASAAPQTVTVSNEGTAAVRQLNLKIGTPGGAFSYTPSCPAILEPKQRCAVRVMFSSRDAETHRDLLTAFDGSTRLAAVTLHGSGVAGGRIHLTASPNSIQLNGSAAKMMTYIPSRATVSARNDGTIDLRALRWVISPPGGPFAMKTDCPAGLAQQQVCTVELGFLPRDDRQYSGTLTAYEGSAQLAMVQLNGVSQSPAKSAGGGGNTDINKSVPTGTQAPTQSRGGGTRVQPSGTSHTGMSSKQSGGGGSQEQNRGHMGAVPKQTATPQPAPPSGYTPAPKPVPKHPPTPKKL